MKTKFSGILTLLLALVVQISFAQEKTISGTVTDNSGLPLPGVNIIVKGTTNGTQSDFDGNYSISTAVGQTLVYSYVGFDNISKPVTAASGRINITMEQGQTLNEVVITGYGGVTKERKSLGYAVTTLDAEAIENKPESDVVRSLNGKVAGVQITATGGATGSGTNFIIRSKSSINGDNQPLFVVDGVPFDGGSNTQTGFAGGNTTTSSRFLDLDPNNVESVSILKGLSAAVLYGQQGRNGVVLITTKNGSTKDLNKKFEVSVSSAVYSVQIANLADYQNTYGQGSDNTPNPGFVGNWGGRFDDNLLIDHPLSANFSDVFPEFDGLQIPYTAAEDNVKDFFRTGLGQTMSVNVAGSPGNEGKTRYNLNFGYASEDGFIRNNGLTRYNIGLGGSTKLSNKLTFNGTANFSNLRVNTPPIAANNAAGSISVFSRTLFLPRNVDLGNLPFENPNDKSQVYYRGDQTNPYWLLNYSGTEQLTNRFFGQVGAAFAISDNATLSYRLGLDSYTENQEYRVAKGANDDGPINGVLDFTDLYRNGYLRTTTGTNFIYDHNLNLAFNNVEITDKIGFSSSVGFNGRRDTYSQFGISSRDQIVFDFNNHNNYLTSSNYDPVFDGGLNYEEEQNILGLYAQLDFNYDKYLFLTLSGRNDWASTLEQESQSLFYPGVSLSFVPSSIDGFGSQEGIGFLKFRASFGTSARFPDPYNTRLALDSNPEGFTDTDGNPLTTNGIPTERPNLNLQPELQQEIEAGLEAEFFNRRLTLDATVYKRTITDQIVRRPLATSTGFRLINDNIAESQIQGIELGINFTPIKSENFSWDVRTNFTAYENEVTDLNGLEAFSFAGFSNLGNFASEGEALGVIKGNYALRYDPSSVDTELNPFGVGVEGVLLINPNDGKIIASDAIEGFPDATVGDPNPDWNATVINGFTYKNVSLSAQIEYQHGGDIYSQTASQYFRRGVTTANVDNREGSFIIPGVLANPDTGEVLKDGSGNPIENNIQIGANDLYFINLVDPTGQGIYDASHLRLREVSLTYSLAEKTLEKTPFGNISFSVSGNNLYIRTFNIPQAFNFDPEALSTGVGNGQGLDFQTGPTTKRYSFSIKASF